MFSTGMIFIPLQNYLRTYRRRSFLSQDEVAFLLGAKTGTRVTRHEGAHRIPKMETALGYEALFGVPLRELFASEAHKVETIIRQRLPELIRDVEERGGSEQKLAFLRSLSERLAQHHENARH
jgi:DNA-binding XRE family transcriptional regulator